MGLALLDQAHLAPHTLNLQIVQVDHITQPLLVLFYEELDVALPLAFQLFEVRDLPQQLLVLQLLIDGGVGGLGQLEGVL